MSHASLKRELEEQWRAERPLTVESAKEIAGDILKDHPKEFRDFTEWFNVHGAQVVERING